MSIGSVKNQLSGLPTSINDVRDKYFENLPLSDEEKLALSNFDKFRMEYLNSAANEEIFEKRYLEIQAKANLASYKDFLEPENLQWKK